MTANKDENRRSLVKALALGGSAAGLAALPGTWTRRVVDSVTLPAHAVTSGPVLSGSLIQPANAQVEPAGADSIVDGAPALGLLSLLVGEAKAGEALPSLGGRVDVFVQAIGGGTMRLQVLLTIDAPLLGRYDAPSIGMLVATAHAAPPDCVVQFLFDLEVELSQTAGGGFESAALALPASPADSCGVPEDTEIRAFGSLQLVVDSPIFPRSGTLRVVSDPRFLDGAVVEISLVSGGSPLVVDCLGNPCEVVLDSDRAIKEDFAAVDEQEILRRVSELPISYWNYTDRDPGVRHIGPMAQDFHGAFAVGDSDRHIHVVDANGVNLASIKALYRMLREKDDKIARLESELDLIKERLGLSG